MNPRDVAMVMMAESRVDPGALNPDGVASGMNQIRNPKNYAPLTQAAYLALPAIEQWDLAVQPYFDGQIRSHPGIQAGGARDLYWLNFLPATYRANTPENAIIVEPDGTYGELAGHTIINSNPVFVLPADKANPVIRPAGLTAFLTKSISGGNAARWSEVLASIDAAEKGTGIVWNGPATRPGSPASPFASVAPAGASTSMLGPALIVGLLGIVAWHRLKRRV